MLSHRVDFPLSGMFAQQETFEYDNLDRLDLIYHGTPGTPATSMSYAANGNITGKTGLGEYTYDSSKPHAVTEIENTGNLLNPRGQSIEYNALNKAAILMDTVDNDAYRLEIIYGPDGQRWKTVLQKNSSVIKTVIFAGDYEKITENGVTKELIYLPGGGIYVKQAGQPDKVYYMHTDHLGSVVSITDGAGAEVFKASYDAWGQQIITNNTIGFHRGYTGHEHLPEFGLINMNGRMYDPIVGRFLSPDPFVQAPEFSQSFNRYSYAVNNPLIYTDPTGEKWWHWLVGDILTGGMISATATLTAATTLTTVSALSMTYSSIAHPTDLLVSWFKGFDDPTAAAQRIQNSFKLAGGLFKTDKNRTFWERTWQLISRHTWEHIQTHAGFGYSSTRNMLGNVDRVDYFGGATFATNENAVGGNGVSIGNYININIDHEITGDFEDYVVTHPLYMHEYGHTFDSRIFGISYLLAIGVPSIISADKSSQVPGEPRGVGTHKFRWYEMRANRHAKKYFKEYYDVDWNTFYRGYDYETFYPTIKRY